MTPGATYSVPRRRPSEVPNIGQPSRHTTYSSAELIEAIHGWHKRYGEPPRMIDWEPARARRCGQGWRAERFESGRWPTARMVRTRFGTFNLAIKAAGIAPRRAPARVRRHLSGPQAVIDALIEWTRRYGDIPAMADWDPVRARKQGQDWRIARFYQGDWPSARAVAFHFDSFAAAADAAGLVPRPRSMRQDQRVAHRAANRLAVAHAVASSDTPGVADLATKLSTLARARKASDPVSLHAALVDLAGAALAWAAVAGSE